MSVANMIRNCDKKETRLSTSLLEPYKKFNKNKNKKTRIKKDFQLYQYPAVTIKSSIFLMIPVTAWSRAILSTIFIVAVRDLI